MTSMCSSGICASFEGVPRTTLPFPMSYPLWHQLVALSNTKRFLHLELQKSCRFLFSIHISQFSPDSYDKSKQALKWFIKIRSELYICNLSDTYVITLSFN